MPGPQGSGHDSIPTYRTFAAGDAVREALCANTEGMWRRLCVALELAELAEDPRFATGQSRYANRSELWDLLEPAFRRRPASEWAAAGVARGVPARVVEGGASHHDYTAGVQRYVDNAHRGRAGSGGSTTTTAITRRARAMT